MFLGKKMVLLMLGVIVVCGVFSTRLSAQGASMSTPKQMSSEAENALLSQIQTIGTKYGEFERTTQKITVPASEIAHNKAEITDHTTEVITDYGVFIKK